MPPRLKDADLCSKGEIRHGTEVSYGGLGSFSSSNLDQDIMIVVVADEGVLCVIQNA